mmetsp:Transcript_40419/g.111403  ORF Transcript_40419/g.111403 Transcript_40419/m.111403 type:complete len:121 (-) Transcript_40419:134-496(-)
MQGSPQDLATKHALRRKVRLACATRALRRRPLPGHMELQFGKKYSRTTENASMVLATSASRSGSAVWVSTSGRERPVVEKAPALKDSHGEQQRVNGPLSSVLLPFAKCQHLVLKDLHGER